MSLEFLDLVRIAGITILATLLWAASIAFTYWDTHHRRLAGGAGFAWLALVALVPFIGFLTYLVFRLFHRTLAPGNPGPDLQPRRETALKPPQARRSPMPTLLAADPSLQANLDPGNTPPTYVLTVSSGADPGREIPLSHLPAQIGRGPEAAIRLDADLGVSRKHAEIYARGGSLRIRDLNSSHGTLVNGSRIEDRSLEPGDRVQIGLTVLVVKRTRE